MELAGTSKLSGEALLQGIINAEPECVKVITREGVPILMNPAGLRVLEAESFEEIAGKSLLPIVLEEDRPAVQRLIDQVFSGQCGRVQFRIGLNGSERWLEMHAGPLREESGEVSALIGVSRDISAQREAEQSLARTQRRVDALVSALGEVIYEWNPRSNQLIWGGAFTKVLGYSPEEMGNSTDSWTERVHPADLPKVLAEVERATKESRLYDLEYRFRHRDGHYKWMHDRGAVFLGEDGQLNCMIGVFVEIHERKIAEEALRTANERYVRQRAAVIQLTRSRVLQSHDLNAALREIAEIASESLSTDRVSVWTFSPSKTILTCLELYDRQAGKHSSGYELKGTSYPSYFRALCSEDIISAQDARTDPRTAEFTSDYLRPLRICAMLDAPIRQGGELVGVLCHEHCDSPREWTPDEESLAVSIAGFISLVLSQSRQEKIEQQLRQAQKMEAIGQLAGGVAHDFNNILAVIMMQSDLLKLEFASAAPEVTEGLNVISGAAEHGANLTRQLLLFSRKQVMQSRDLDLNEIVTGIARMLQRVIGADVSLKIHLHPTPLHIRADPGMLDQILLNLAVNARDAMHSGGSLLIETSELLIDEDEMARFPEAEPGRYVSFSVSDTGEGIPPEILPRIFEPFFTTKAPEKGTGLGLATVFGIVKQHRGFIKVYSEVDRGSRFQVFLPSSQDSRSSTASAAARPKPRGGKETILIAEDDASLRFLTRILLERHGYSVFEAGDAGEAITIWKDHSDKIDLLLTDMVMPGGFTGQQLAAQLRAEKETLKVIYTSGYSAEFAGRQIELREGDNFLQKPSPPDQILETVRRCLDA